MSLASNCPNMMEWSIHKADQTTNAKIDCRYTSLPGNQKWTPLASHNWEQLCEFYFKVEFQDFKFFI